MATISFQTLKTNYPYPEKLNHDELFDELGWGKSLKEDPGLTNTCAIRMSYCLVQSGLNIRGGYKILKGPHKSKWIETSQKTLTKYIRNNLQAQLGTPQSFKKSEKNNFLLKKKKGLMSFMEIDGYQDTSGNPSGHIDLIWTEKDTTSIFGLELWSTTSEECGTHCYWDQSKELLFWELK
ncbi:T6SS effector amidase Tae4 family protein [Cystobacter fuscus]